MAEELIPYEKPLPPIPERTMRQLMRNGLLFLPNLLKLAFRLLKDARVPSQEKILLAATIVYVISPLDFIPDLIPFIGQVDDSYLLALSLLRLLNSADAEVIREHWDGGGDIYRLLIRISNLATIFLPKRVQKLLVKRIDLPESVADFSAYAAQKKSRES
ncbi:MAG: DUF1232 domain-containing protein [Blastocatellia bacterium]|nr:DUF1232 domain-containing protein [Blastocatellia bacterium]